TMNMYGGYLHTRGLGAYYRRGWRQTGFVNKIYNVEFLSVNHPKQYKIETVIGTQGYFEGKVNSVYFLRNSFGWQKSWFDKEVKRGVRVSGFLLFGPTLAFAKPIFVDVEYTESGNEATERYDYDKHSSQAIIKGRAPFLLGLNETSIHPGLHLKMALNFEYSPDDETIRSLETGFNFDAFPKVIPILANTYNDQFFLTLYIGLHFGKRYL
ncbi:MAG: hypothetical protein WEC59_04850, partial [Salibacteraceae bacterium]